MVMRVGGPQDPSPPSPGRLSCTRTLYPVFGLRFINVTFSLGSTGGAVHSIHHSVPTSSRSRSSPFSSSLLLTPLFLPLHSLLLSLLPKPCPAPAPAPPPALSPTHPQWQTRPWSWDCPGAGSAGGQRQWVHLQRRRPVGTPQAGDSAWPGA